MEHFAAQHLDRSDSSKAYCKVRAATCLDGLQNIASETSILTGRPAVDVSDCRMDVKSAACLSAVHSVDSQVDAVLDAARSQMHTCDIYGLGEQCVLALDKLADTLRPNFLLQPCHRLVEVRREVLQLIKVKLVRHHPEMARSRLLSTLMAGGKRSERSGVSSDSLMEQKGYELAVAFGFPALRTA